MSIRRLLLAVLPFAVLVDCSIAQEPMAVVSNAQLVLIHNVEVASRSGGVVTELGAVPGKAVKKGDLIVRLDANMPKTELEIARLELAVAEKQKENQTNLELARKSKEVSKKIVERSTEAFAKYADAISQTEIDQQKLELDKTILSEKQANHDADINGMTARLRKEQVNLSKLQLQHQTMSAPLDGQIVEVMPQVGEWVDPGETIARIINAKVLRVEAIVPAKLVGEIEKGHQAKFTGFVGDEKVEVTATISFVSPEIHPVNQDFKVWAEIENSENELLPGIVGEITLFRY